MVAQSPPFALQNASHSAALFRQATFSAFRKGGTVGPSDFAVTAQGTPNMSVLVSAGRGWMTGTQVASVSGGTWSPQAGYFGINDAPVTLTVSAADPTNPRIDLVVAYATDSFYSGSTNTFVLGVVTGTPAATPAAPAAPNNALVCGTIAVAANATSIVSGNISNTAGLLTVARGGILPVTSTDVTAGEFVDQYRGHPTLGLQRWNGSRWQAKNSGRVLYNVGAPTTDAGGAYTFPHGLGVAPVNVQVTTTQQASDLLQRIGVVKVINYDATNIVVCFVRTDTSAYLTASLLSFDWVAWS